VRQGYGEMLKHSLIKPDAFHLFLDELEKGFNPSSELIKEHALFKAKVVLDDPFESRERKFLNFGHTFAHWLEAALPIGHGQAVAWGCVVATILSREKFGLSEDVVEKTKAAARKILRPVVIDPHLILQKSDVLKFDKKKSPTGQNFVLLKELGLPTIVPVLEVSLIQNAVFEASL